MMLSGLAGFGPSYGFGPFVLCVLPVVLPLGLCNNMTGVERVLLWHIVSSVVTLFRVFYV